MIKGKFSGLCNPLPQNPKFKQLSGRSLRQILWKKETMLVTGITIFFPNVVHPIRDILTIFNTVPNKKVLDWSKLREFANNNFRFDENGRKFYFTVGKGETAKTISPFPTVFPEDFYCRHLITRACLGKG